MGEKEKNIKLLLLLFLPSILLLSILLLFGENFILSVATAIFYCVFLIAFIKPKAGLLLILLVRPCLDYFTNLNFNLFGNSINLAGAFAVMTIAFSLFVIVKNLGRLEKVQLLLPWIIFILAMAATVPISMNASSSMTELARLLSILMIFISASLLIKDAKDLADLIKALVLSALLPSILAIWQYFTHTGLTIPLEGVYNRVYGTFAHPNLLAFYLLLALTLCFLVFLASDKQKVSILSYGALAGIFLVTLGFTYTRSAWLGLLLVVLLLGVTRYRAFLIVSLILLSLSYFSIENINQRISAFSSHDPGSSINWRINLWKDGMSYTSQRPIMGYGAGTSKELILKKRGPEAGSSDAHNDYLRVLLEGGLLGLTAFGLLTMALLKKLLTIYKLEIRPRLKSLSFVCLVMFIGFCLIAFGDNILANTALQWAMWALFGGLMSAQRRLLA
jgi:O-antigen ligase